MCIRDSPLDRVEARLVDPRRMSEVHRHEGYPRKGREHDVGGLGIVPDVGFGMRRDVARDPHGLSLIHI